MSYIYVITNDINNKQYVGKTNCSIEKRFQQHKNDSGRKKCEIRPLYRAMNKYGVEHFSIKQLEECLEQDASEREIYWINKLDTYHNGYNATYGGDGKTLYNYQELADAYNSGLTMKEVAKKFHCDEGTVVRACHNCDCTIRIPSNYEQVHQIKAVYMIDKHTNEIINNFSSIADAARYLVEIEAAAPRNLNGIRGHISAVCKNKRITAYGYKWKYINNVE